MTYASRLSFAAVGVLFAVGCSGAVDEEPRNRAPDEKKSEANADDTTTWPETVETTSAWPHFGSARDGVVTAPTWVAPPEMGCEQRVRVKHEPQREWLPGEGPRTITVAKLDSVCKPAGTTVRVVDDPSYPAATIFSGSCAEGMFLSTSVAQLAELHFSSPAECESFVALREKSKTGDATRRLRTVLRLTATKPTVKLDWVSSEEGATDDGFEFIEEAR